MEFFAMPNEFSCWIGDIIFDSQLWILMWRVHRKEYVAPELKDLNDYVTERRETSIQFFIGNKKITEGPKMVKSIDGTTRIDFLNSLCVQVIPPFIRNGVLLEGAIRTFRPREYAVISADQKFISWKGRVTRQFKSSVCEPTAEVAQSLSDGREKRLRGVAISRGAIEWYRSGGRLKQFYDGPVEFVPRIGIKT